MVFVCSFFFLNRFPSTCGPMETTFDLSSHQWLTTGSCYGTVDGFRNPGITSWCCKYPMIYRVLEISNRWLLGISEPSTDEYSMNCRGWFYSELLLGVCPADRVSKIDVTQIFWKWRSSQARVSWFTWWYNISYIKIFHIQKCWWNYCSFSYSKESGEHTAFCSLSVIVASCV